MTEETIKKLTRQLVRARDRAHEMKKDYSGREGSLTFHAGWNIGYELGKISALESILDEEEADA